jgi:diguanylate cyclase (GGDEF)-like protein
MAAQSYILLVEDNPGDAVFAQSVFDEQADTALPGMRWVQTTAAALHMLHKEPGCAIVLLDLGLPDSQGLEGLAAIKAHAPDIPIVVLSGDDNDELGLAAVVAGAQDYLVKGSFDGGLLTRALRYAAQRKRVEVALIARSLHDDLTGLPRRALLRDRLDSVLKRCARDKSLGAILFVDLDHFKKINDTHGHAAGDAVLRAVGERLAGVVRGSDTVARLGGDEFVVLLPSVAGPQDAQAVGEKLLSALAEITAIEGQPVTVSASIGVVCFSDASEIADSLLARADAAMYSVKKSGRGAVSSL